MVIIRSADQQNPALYSRTALVLLLIQANANRRHHRQIHIRRNSNIVSLLTDKNLPHIHKLPTNLCNDHAIQGDGGAAVEPIAFDEELDGGVGRCVGEGGDHLRFPDGEFGFDFEELVAVGGFGVEGFVDAEEFVTEVEEGAALVVGEFFSVGYGEGFALAFADCHAGLVHHGEAVAGKGPDFFFEDEGGLFGHAVSGVHSKRRCYRCELWEHRHLGVNLGIVMRYGDP